MAKLYFKYGAMGSSKSAQALITKFNYEELGMRVWLIKPAKVIVVEGILIFADKELCSEMDIKIFVDTDADVRILRRIVRDVRDRGRSLESVISQYLTTVKPMHEQFVEPSKRNADIIIPEGGHNIVAFDMVVERVRAHINRAEVQ